MRLLRPYQLVVIMALGCTEATPPQQHMPALVESWADMGMYLPDNDQVEFIRANLTDISSGLASAISHSNPSVRQRAAYVAGKIGTDAVSLGPALCMRLKDEPDRLVRIYFYDALSAIGFSSSDVISQLKQRYEALGSKNDAPSLDGGYADVDEKINVAAALFVLGDQGEKTDYLEFVVQWLRPLPSNMTPEEIAGYWERRWVAVISLEGMPDAMEAIPVLESMLEEDSTKSWVPIHVPRVLDVLRNSSS